MHLQEDLNKMINWSDIWFRKFNKEKCKLLTVKSLIDRSYYIHINNASRKQETVTSEKDIGVIFDS